MPDETINRSAVNKVGLVRMFELIVNFHHHNFSQVIYQPLLVQRLGF